MCVPGGRGEGGRGGEGGGGGKGGEGVGTGRDFGAPRHKQPKSTGGRRNFTAGTWGSFMGSHREGPPPPPTMVTLRGGGQWGGD